MEVTGTVYFDGRFWKIIIEKIEGPGEIQLATHTFGSEPTNQDILAFYLYRYQDLVFRKTPARVRIRKNRRPAEQGRTTSKSLELIKELRKPEKKERTAAGRVLREVREAEKYRQRVLKKREKRKGH